MVQKKQVYENSERELTTDKLLTYPGFEHFTEEDAQVAIQNIKKLAKILFSIYEHDTNSQNPIK